MIHSRSKTFSLSCSLSFIYSQIPIHDCSMFLFICACRFPLLHTIEIDSFILIKNSAMKTVQINIKRMYKLAYMGHKLRYFLCLTKPRANRQCSLRMETHILDFMSIWIISIIKPKFPTHKHTRMAWWIYIYMLIHIPIFLLLFICIYI